MSTTIMADSNADGGAPRPYSLARLMGWCMRRELWENRSIVIAPFAAAGLMIFSILIPVAKMLSPSQRFEVVGNIQDDTHLHALWMPYVLVAMPVLAIGVFVAITYCLSALNGERRDRSILFWKSLPVSDLITILSKAGVPLVLVPLVSFVAAVLTQLAVFAIALIVFPLVAAKAHLVWNGMPINSHTIGLIWSAVPVGYITFAMLYGVLATALWHAPIYAWLLLVGGWARRVTVVWAVAPVAGLIIAERVGLGSDRLGELIQHRLGDSVFLAFSNLWDSKLPEMTPVRFVSDPGLWMGLAVAALFLGLAVLLRRYRQPI